VSLHRSFFAILLLVIAAGALPAQVQVSLGAGTGCNSLQAAQTCSLSARVTGAANLAVTWSFTPQVPGAVTGSGTAPDPTGLSTNTYKAPNFITSRTIVTASATSVADPSQTASTFITLVPVTITVAVNPNAVSLAAGQSQGFTATVSGISQTGVTWSINPQIGSIDPAAGVYTAPSLITATQKISVIATSTFDTTVSGSATVTLTPVSVVVTPATATLNVGQQQQFTASLTNAASGVTWSINPSIGTIDTTGLYTAPATLSATAATKITVTATSIDDSTKFGTATITLNPPPPISVSVSPSSVALTAGQTQQFTATLQNSVHGVTWSVSQQGGTIDQTGLYTAPSVTTSTKVTITAASVDDPSKTGTASVTVNPAPAVTVTVSPATVSLGSSQTQQFTATVSSGPQGVTWSISPASGTIDQTGFYTAPAIISATVTVTVTATSVADASKTGTAKITLAAVVDVGVGAPPSLVGQFVSAYFRNGFNFLTSLPPLGNVKKLGTTGYVQEFNDANKTPNVKLALATLSSTVNPSQPDGSNIQIAQLGGYIYPYYSTVGAGTAGYPLMDSQNCPSFSSSNLCQYDFFDKSYALFAYALPLSTGQNFAVNGTFYTEWTTLGGIAGPGRPIDVQTTVTASTATTATMQAFATGVIYSTTSGANRGKIYGVIEPLYDLYVAQNTHLGKLGLPTSEALQVSTGLYKQTFEGGSLQYTSGSNGGPPVIQLPVVSVAVNGAPSTGVTLNLGQSLTLTAVPATSDGTVLSDRPVSWSSTNGKVVSIAANGLSAVVTAIGGGSAGVTASSQGVTSAKVNFTVLAPCCQIGAGAPASVAQAFLDAITRNKLSVQLPAPSPASRVGAGYVQMVQSSDPKNPAVYMLTQSDQLGAAYVVTGAILTQYQNLGGPAGALGYPSGDAGAGGTQLFANGSALAGNPVRVVSGGVLTKWALMGYEIGAAGPPTSDPAPFTTLGANSGFAQSFKNGVIYAASSGPRAGQAYFVTGLILTRYNQLSAAAGDYGMPTSDEFASGSVHQQNFEGGNLTYSTGDAAAVEHPGPKTPAVIVAPGAVTAGGEARLAFLGFANNATVKVSITGQTDFQVTTANGAYSWDISIPLSAKSGTLTIHAADTKSSAIANGTLTVRGFADNRVPLAKIQGDNQTGMPGATLPLSLRVALKDSSGTPVSGATVVFQASTGAQLSAASATTDVNGQAETFVRLPNSEGITAVTADVPSIAQAPVSFYVRSAASSLSNFPKLVMAGDTALGHGTASISRKGALVTAVASILRYHQNRGDIPAPNGSADPGTLNSFLTSYCATQQLCDGYLNNPASGEQIVNLWRAAEFTGGLNVIAVNPTVTAIADLLAQGHPVLLSLALSVNGNLAGGHFVTAIGVASDGSIQIQDPNPLFARTSLSDYLGGFSAAGSNWKAVLGGAVEFALASPPGTRFLMGALSQPASLMQNFGMSAQSAVGPCGLPLDLLDSVDSQGIGSGALTSRLLVCDGLQPAYTITLGAAQSYSAFATDLAANGTSQDLSAGALAFYKASRPQLALVLAPQDVSFTADGVVNAGTFTSGIAPGGIMAIFGSGLAASGTSTSVTLDGNPVQVLGATPFQINAVVPQGTTPGTHILTISSTFGNAQQPVDIATVAPAIFLVGNPPVGAVVNQDGTLNSPGAPLPRGQVLILYATGLGAVANSRTVAPVTLVVNGRELPVAYAGIAPGAPGEYQVNVVIPGSTPPGVNLPVALKQSGILSNTVLVTLQ
jgi:uncharacterized protein (TIGR03437 family)